MMTKQLHSIDVILEAMPRVRSAVRDDIAKRIADGEDIYHSRDGNVMINDRVIKTLSSATETGPKRAQRRAA